MALPHGCLQYVIVAFSEHTHLIVYQAPNSFFCSTAIMWLSFLRCLGKCTILIICLFSIESSLFLSDTLLYYQSFCLVDLLFTPPTLLSNSNENKWFQEKFSDNRTAFLCICFSSFNSMESVKWHNYRKASILSPMR